MQRKKLGRQTDQRSWLLKADTMSELQSWQLLIGRDELVAAIQDFRGKSPLERERHISSLVAVREITNPEHPAKQSGACVPAASRRRFFFFQRGWPKLDPNPLRCLPVRALQA